MFFSLDRARGSRPSFAHALAQQEAAESPTPELRKQAHVCDLDRAVRVPLELEVACGSGRHAQQVERHAGLGERRRRSEDALDPRSRVGPTARPQLGHGRELEIGSHHVDGRHDG